MKFKFYNRILIISIQLFLLLILVWEIIKYPYGTEINKVLLAGNMIGCICFFIDSMFYISIKLIKSSFDLSKEAIIKRLIRLANFIALSDMFFLLMYFNEYNFTPRVYVCNMLVMILIVDCFIVTIYRISLKLNSWRNKN